MASHVLPAATRGDDREMGVQMRGATFSAAIGGNGF
jgi:hypothetical protein